MSSPPICIPRVSTLPRARGLPRSNPFDAISDESDEFNERVRKHLTKPRMSVDNVRELYAELGIGGSNCASESSFGISREEELELAIDNCKELIRKENEHSEKRKKLVKKLIEFRMQLHELHEGLPSKREQATVKWQSGHKFVLQDTSRSSRYCERCCYVIWSSLQAWLQCEVCGYSCHEKCLLIVTRTCAGERVREKCKYNLKICPEVGLARQNYRCADCKAKLSYARNSESQEPRLCDYSGLYFCPSCHWNDLMVIPGRVVHNWDFELLKVSRPEKQFLKLMYDKPVIKLESINPGLFNYVEELRLVKRMRSDVLLVKCYLMCCRSARDQRLLTKLRPRQHFVESADMYSLKDLVEVQSGQLQQDLSAVLEVFLKHIKQECEVCRGNGFLCEICDDKKEIFPFDDYVSICRQCFAVFHRLCFDKRRRQCPRCERRRKRSLCLEKSLTPSDEEPSSVQKSIDNLAQPMTSERSSDVSTQHQNGEPEDPDATNAFLTDKNEHNPFNEGGNPVNPFE